MTSGLMLALIRNLIYITRQNAQCQCILRRRHEHGSQTKPGFDKQGRVCMHYRGLCATAKHAALECVLVAPRQQETDLGYNFTPKGWFSLSHFYQIWHGGGSPRSAPHAKIRRFGFKNVGSSKSSKLVIFGTSLKAKYSGCIQTRGQSNLTKSASRLGVTPGGRSLYHWIPGVGFPISVP